MDITDLALAIYLTFLTTGLGALVWARMNRIEERMVTKEEMAAFREEMATFRYETNGRFEEMNGRFEQHRGETTGGFAGLHSEMAIMRSDLTHVALAVGAKPRASEG